MRRSVGGVVRGVRFLALTQTRPTSPNADAVEVVFADEFGIVGVLRKHLLNIAQNLRKSEIQPHRLRAFGSGSQEILFV